MRQVTLVFPSSMSAALSYSEKARQRGEQVIAASSVKADETAKLYDQWIFLPSIYEADFLEAFSCAIKEHGITHFFTPHAVIYSAVERMIREQSLPIVIAESSPIETLNAHYRDVLQRAGDAISFASAIDDSFNLSTVAMASLLHHAGQIYGQTSESKIAAMAGVFASAPKGDVIEIGSAWGRSAFVLSFLAQHYNIGNVLAIDPWDEGVASQKESSADLEKVNRTLDWQLMFQIFIIHMLPFAGNFNYLRAISINAEKEYKKGLVETPEFGKTSLKQKVSVIHIDGNHDYESVAADCATWLPNIQAGGWLILDDYVWEHGTGPRLVGDALLQEKKANIELAFTAGKALFVQFRDAT